MPGYAVMQSTVSEIKRLRGEKNARGNITERFHATLTHQFLFSQLYELRLPLSFPIYPEKAKNPLEANKRSLNALQTAPQT